MTNPLLQTDTSYMAAELASQPEMWERAREVAAHDALVPDGAKVAVIGCGTSWFIAQSYASVRESGGHGVTDAFAASEAYLPRDYDYVVALTRSGTTTEVLAALRAVRGSVPTVGIVGDPDTPLVGLVDRVIKLPFADEKSVVQTRFATTALAYMRATLGADLSSAIDEARAVLDEDPVAEIVSAEQITFLGRGWTVGLANEAGLKLRESSQSWTESYPAMEYRHGPISIAAPGRVTWLFGEEPKGLAADVTATGARYEHRDIDPLAELVRAHVVALARARARGLNPDVPRSLTRSVILGS